MKYDCLMAKSIDNTNKCAHDPIFGKGIKH